jgi:S-DNA-T family DNA segregation ATPase FtsK/SpoIIIE
MASKLRRMPATRKGGSASARKRRTPAPARRRPARRSRKRAPAQAIRGALARSFASMPVLDQRQRELLGLAALALGAFLAFVLYGGWDGGSAGHGLTVGLGWVFGGARLFVPAALLLGGVVLLSRPALPAARPLRSGTLCLFACVTLALAAGTLGLSSGPGTAAQQWTSAHMQSHGGVFGEALFQLADPLVREVGVSILVVFLALAAALLLTGASLSGLLNAGASRVAESTRVVRTGLVNQAAAGQDLDGAAATAQLPLLPEEGAPGDYVVRAATPAGQALDWRELAEPEPLESASDPAADDSPEQADEPEPALPRAHADDEGDGEPSGLFARSTPEDSELTPQGRLRSAVTDDPNFVWELPAAGELLARSGAEAMRPDTAGQERVAAALVEALGHFGVEAKVIGTVTGPHITRYELRLAPGTKVGAVAKLKDDLAYALAATDIRILAPIPGKQAVGVEVPNRHRKIVRLGDVFGEPPRDSSPLTVWLGKDVAGKAIGADLAKMPHLLVAGTTGAGKSGAINAMLCSLLLRATPHELRLVLVDPKQVELNHYESIPHLLTPVITSPRMAANALANLVKEMESRYGIMSLARTRSLTELNKARQRRSEAPLPYILCVIDELADLMMVAPADVEDSIIRLAQKARAVGIHLVLATQSPRVDVITGMIKANVPSRIAFAVSSQTDSRVILDQNGAESLLGQGDMLFSPVGSSRLQRIQGAYIDEPQIAKLTELWRRQGEPELREELLEEVEPAEGESPREEFDPDEDPLLRDAITLVAEMQTASTSMLQRRLRLGYTRAGRMIDMLEKRKVISGYEGSKPRQVLITEADLPRLLAELEEPAPTLSD